MQHHANLLIGPDDWAFSIIPKEYTKESRDVHSLKYDKMNIVNARELIREAGLKPAEAEVHVFIVTAQKILREAQNALLKLLEEPNPKTIFYFVLPSKDVLIPTLLSRFHLLSKDDSSVSKEAFNEFRKLSYSERLKLIEKKLKEEDVRWVNDVVEGLEVHAHNTRNKRLIEDVLMLVKYIKINGSSKKMLLEHMALSPNLS